MSTVPKPTAPDLTFARELGLRCGTGDASSDTLMAAGGLLLELCDQVEFMHAQFVELLGISASLLGTSVR